MGIKKRHVFLSLLILVPSIISIAVPLYNVESPVLFGIPFFYWFQTLWLVISFVFYMAYTHIKEKQK